MTTPAMPAATATRRQRPRQHQQQQHGSSVLLEPPQAHAKVAYWGCALPCCGALVLSALLQQRQQQQRQWQGKQGPKAEAGVTTAAALSLLRLGVLTEDEYGAVAAAATAAGGVPSADAVVAADEEDQEEEGGIALTATTTAGSKMKEEEQAVSSPLPPTVCSSSSPSISSLCTSFNSSDGDGQPLAADGEEEEESKEEEEQPLGAPAGLLDPITLEPLGPAARTFTLRVAREGDHGGVTYNLEPLARYLVASGRFVEPTSRSPLGTAEVAAMAWQLEEGMGLRALGEELRSAFAAAEEKLAVARERMDLLEGLDRCVGEVVTEMLRLAEGPHSITTHHPSSSYSRVGVVERPQGQQQQECEEEVRLCLLLPHFEHFFAQLVQADAAYALQCLDQYIRHLRGPPNCPTQDGGRGLLWACLRLLKEKERALKQQLLEGEEGERDEDEEEDGGGHVGGGVMGLAARALAAVWNGRW